MNSVQLLGRLVRDPDVRYSQNAEGSIAVARFVIAVDRYKQTDGKQTADFICCVTFKKSAEFVEKYLRQGTKIACTGSILTGSYTNKEGTKIYTTEVSVNHFEFAESKAENSSRIEPPDLEYKSAEDEFMNLSNDYIGDEKLPFN